MLLELDAVDMGDDEDESEVGDHLMRFFECALPFAGPAHACCLVGFFVPPGPKRWRVRPS